MADIPIWPGSSSFGLISNPTPFAFYDDDAEFRADADKVSVWCAQRLGYPLIDVELQEVNFFSCFEEAVTEYGAQVYNFQIKDNIGKLRGSPTGSTLNQINIKDDFSTNFDVQGSYDAGGYSSEKRIYSASLDVKKNQQKYDLLTNGGVNFESGSSGIAAGDTEIRIKKIYHYAPSAINRYFDPYAGTGTVIQSLMQTFGMGNYSPGVNFMLMPIYFDTLKLQAIELNDVIRKSAYHFELVNNRYLKLFPIPKVNTTLHFEFVLKSVANAPVKNDATNLITDISNVPYTNPTYAFINEPGRQWIRRYMLALAKEMLGSVRGKYQAIPVPGDTTTLDYARLLAEAQAEKLKLIEELQKLLDETTRLKQLERQNQEAQQTQETFYKVPYPIYVG